LLLICKDGALFMWLRRLSGCFVAFDLCELGVVWLFSAQKHGYPRIASMLSYDLLFLFSIFQ